MANKDVKAWIRKLKAKKRKTTAEHLILDTAKKRGWGKKKRR